MTCGRQWRSYLSNEGDKRAGIIKVQDLETASTRLLSTLPPEQRSHHERFHLALLAHIRTLHQKIDGRQRRAAHQRVSPRELAVMGLLATGHSNKQVGQRLSIAVKTVEKHRANLYRKLGCRNVSDLTRIYLSEYGSTTKHQGDVA